MNHWKNWTVFLQNFNLWKSIILNDNCTYNDFLKYSSYRPSSTWITKKNTKTTEKEEIPDWFILSFSLHRPVSSNTAYQKEWPREEYQVLSKKINSRPREAEQAFPSSIFHDFLKLILWRCNWKSNNQDKQMKWRLFYVSKRSPFNFLYLGTQ